LGRGKTVQPTTRPVAPPIKSPPIKPMSRSFQDYCIRTSPLDYSIKWLE
jgi:hypothetical protein